MKTKIEKIEFNGKWLFDKAMEKGSWQQEIFDCMIAKTVEKLDAAERNEFWQQYNFWKWQTQQ